MPHDIIELFDPYRGDLVYGFAADRTSFYEHVEQRAPDTSALKLFFDRDGYDPAWIQVDHYNDTLFGGSQLFKDKPQDVADIASQVQDSWIKYFWEEMSKHRFSPLEAFNTPDAKRNKEGWKDLAEDRYYLAIRRGCKFGIEHILSQHIAAQGAKIHFLLDRFHRSNGERMVAATYKEPSDARGRISVSITYSEIRYIYRNWGRLKDSIEFYYDFISAVAPWEDDVRQATWLDRDTGAPKTDSYKNLWTIYGGARKNKYAEMLDMAKVKHPFEAQQHKVKIDALLVGIGNLSNSQQIAKYEEAIKLLEPDRNKWRELQI